MFTPYGSNTRREGKYSGMIPHPRTMAKLIEELTVEHKDTELEEDQGKPLDIDGNEICVGDKVVVSACQNFLYKGIVTKIGTYKWFSQVRPKVWVKQSTGHVSIKTEPGLTILLIKDN
jgi:hypothetical protein